MRKKEIPARPEVLLLRELSREVDAMDVLFRWSTEKDLVLINSGAQSLSLAPKHCRDQQERQHRRSRLVQQLHLNHVFLASGTKKPRENTSN